jgi:hypothetical protein
VGTVYQVVGVTLFIASMFVCCASSLISKETATRTSLNEVGWHVLGDFKLPLYSAQMAITVSLAMTVFLGVAVATVGLGLQAQKRRSPALAMTISFVGMAFWLVHVSFFADVHGLLMLGLSVVMSVLFIALHCLAFAAWREMRRNPTPAGFEILPSDYKVPYSHMHEDPPEVRLERELEARKERLAVQQKELQLLEEKLRRKMKEKES